jgi:eukaryotic-like serine/threonine-protein kinase
MPETIGRYRIVKKLGSGGMGEVYLGEDLRLRRFVALKVISGAIDQIKRARFEREAHAASILTHPNICSVHEVGETEDGGLFIAMEFVDGTSLSERLSSGRLPFSEVLDIAIEVADALAEAHRRGVIHRDLKPANVMLTAGKRVKVVDFGLAQTRDDAPFSVASTTQVKLTTPGVVLGTAQYMSPEQARGEPLDERSDLFSFGCVLYEMATGRPPFTGASSVEILNQTINVDPPSMRGVPPELERIVRKCLEKWPDRRYQSAKELAVDLRRLSAPLVPAVATAPPRAAWRRVARPAFYSAAGLLVLAAALLSFNLRERLLGRVAISPIRSLAVLPLANLSGDPSQEYFADGMTEELITYLAQVSALKVISRTSVMRYKGAKESLPQIARELGVDALIEGSVLREGDQVRITVQLIEGRSDRHLWAADYQREMHGILALQSSVARAIAAEVKAKLTPREHARFQQARSVDPDAYEAYLRGRYYLDKRTEEGFKKALEYFQDAVQKDPSSALSYAGLGDTYNFLSYFHILPPPQARPEAKAAALKALKLDPSSAEAHTALARVMAEYEWDWQGAEREFQQAIELNPSYAIAHQYYGLFLSDMGRHPEAIAEGKKAVELDPLSLPVRNSLGSRFQLARQYDSAIEQYRKVLEMYANRSFTHLNLGWTYVQKKMYEEATVELLRTISLSGPEPEALSDLGYAYAASGDRSEAEKVLVELNRVASQRYVPPIMMARIYIGLGDQTRALAWLEKSYQDRSLSEFDPLVDPAWDPLRSDPRFRDLLRRMGLPQ